MTRTRPQFGLGRSRRRLPRASDGSENPGGARLEAGGIDLRCSLIQARWAPRQRQGRRRRVCEGARPSRLELEFPARGPPPWSRMLSSVKTREASVHAPSALTPRSAQNWVLAEKRARGCRCPPQEAWWRRVSLLAPSLRRLRGRNLSRLLAGCSPEGEGDECESSRRADGADVTLPTVKGKWKDPALAGGGRGGKPGGSGPEVLAAGAGPARGWNGCEGLAQRGRASVFPCVVGKAAEMLSART